MLFVEKPWFLAFSDSSQVDGSSQNLFTVSRKKGVLSWMACYWLVLQKLIRGVEPYALMFEYEFGDF